MDQNQLAESLNKLSKLFNEIVEHNSKMAEDIEYPKT